MSLPETLTETERDGGGSEVRDGLFVMSSQDGAQVLEGNDVVENSAPVSPSSRRGKGVGEAWHEARGARGTGKRKGVLRRVEVIDEGKEDCRHETSRVPRLSSTPEPTKMALKLHREVIRDVKAFVTAPVPISLGTLQCSLTRYSTPAERLFGSAVEVWELRITDRRVRYDGVARFTNVNETTSAGSSSEGPSLADLAKNRLVLVAEKRTRGYVNKSHSYIFALADCASFHQRIDDKKVSHLIGKLVGTDTWGKEFRAFQFSSFLRSGLGPVPVATESLMVKYHCSLGNPRQLIAAIPQIIHSDTTHDDLKGKSNNHSELWQNEIAPEVDVELGGCKVIPKYQEDTPLANSLEDFDLDKCLGFYNRKPLWDEVAGSHILDFGGRVSEPSVKNFQLDMSEDPQQCRFVEGNQNKYRTLNNDTDSHERPPIVQFGKCTSPNKQVMTFTLDVRFPFSVIQAMQLAMSSIDSKIVYY